MNLALLLADEDDVPDPHPALVESQQPTPAQVMAAAAVLGLFPVGSYLAGELAISAGRI